MEIAKKFLEKNQPQLALEHLKKFLQKNFYDEWKIHEMIGACFHDLANAEKSAQAYLNAAQTDKFLRTQREHFSNYIFASHYLPNKAEFFLEIAKIYNSLYRDTKIFPQKNNFNKKIHVGFIAPHFLESSSARFYEILLTNYNREKFFVSAWSLSDKKDNFTEKICENTKFFGFSEINFEKIAEKIFSENVDILIDLGGHTEGGETLQVMAYKPAKIQISAIGYFDTTGLDAIDFFITDKFMATENFIEKKILLENAFAFKPSEKIILAKKNLKKFYHENIIFGCLNNFMKITDEYLRVVKKILDTVKNSKIIFRDTTNLESRKIFLIERIKNIGIKNFEVRVGENNFFRDYGEIDLILDTFPYSGGFMTALAIYFEKPVINLIGEKHFERLGADILKISCNENLIAKNINEYIEKSVEISKNLDTKIFAGKLFDTKNFVEDFYNKIVEVRL